VVENDELMMLKDELIVPQLMVNDGDDVHQNVLVVKVDDVNHHEIVLKQDLLEK
jgi:hypothetical protein